MGALMPMKSTTERTVKTKFDGDARDGIRAAKAMERELARLDRERAKAEAKYTADTVRGAEKVISSFAGVTKGILAVGSAVGSAQGLAGAVSAVATLSGTALALPGILAGGAAAGGVFALAMSGVGDAIAAKDLEEFNEVTKNMAPNAVKTAAAIRDQNARFTEMKKTVQGKFFDGFDQDIRDLAENYFPVLHKQSADIATAWNKMGREGAKALLDPRAVDQVNGVLKGTRAGLDEMSPALGNVVTGFLGLSSVGSTKLPALGRVVNGLTQDFEDWVNAGLESGRINELIDEGIDTAKQFGRVLTNTGEIGRSVWRGLGAGGADFLGGLEETTQALEDFFESAEGQQALKTLGQALSTTADVARDVFTAALRELGPVVTKLGPAFIEIAQSIGETLVRGLEIAGPMLQDVAEFLSENKEILGDLVPLLLGAALAYKGLVVAKEAATWVSGLGAAFVDVDKKAKGAADSVGTKNTGLIGGLSLLKVVGAGILISGVTSGLDSLADDAKEAETFVERLGKSYDRATSILQDLLSLDVKGALNKATDPGALTDSPLVSIAGALARQQKENTVTLKISSDTSQAQRNLEDLKGQIRRTEEYVQINGNRRTADQALAETLAAIDRGEGTVNIGGVDVDAQRALLDLIGQINASAGTVTVDGNPVPAGQVLFGLLRTVTGSRATMSIDADDSAAQGVVNSFIRMNNGKTVDIFVNAKGDAGGIASAGRLASGGSARDAKYFSGAVRGPGTRTSDTAGLFALSNDEHVWSAADVSGAGGHGAMYRLRALARQGALRGFADGGTPAYLTTSVPAPRLVPNVNVAAPNTMVTVLIDGQKFRGMIKAEIETEKQEAKRITRSGPGGAWS